MNVKLLAGAVLLSSLGAAAPAALAQDYGNEIECSSRDFHFQRCANWNDARLIRQTSDARCSRGYSWGVDRKGLWVDKGCTGVFRNAGSHGGYGGGGYGHDHDHDGGGGGWNPGAGWDSEFAFRCASRDYGYTFCAVDLGGGGRARLVGQHSNTACIEGRTWGYNRAGVWVDKGCEADFTITRRWR